MFVPAAGFYRSRNHSIFSIHIAGLCFPIGKLRKYSTIYSFYEIYLRLDDSLSSWQIPSRPGTAEAAALSVTLLSGCRHSRISYGQGTTDRIVALIKGNPRHSAKSLADAIEISPKGVEKQLAKLKAQGIIRRIGPDKGGTWEVVERG